MIKFLKFGAVGILNTFITIGSFMIFVYFGMNYIIANVVAYSFGVINSFYWNNTWVFQTRSRSSKVLSKFVVVNLITLGVTTIILFLLVEHFSLHSIAGQILATGCGMVINFMLNKSWTFTNTAINMEENNE
jgi:putative flippase GtrA